MVPNFDVRYPWNRSIVWHYGNAKSYLLVKTWLKMPKSQSKPLLNSLDWQKPHRALITMALRGFCFIGGGCSEGIVTCKSLTR